MVGNDALTDKIDSIKEIFEALPSGVITFDSEFKIQYFNRNFITLFFCDLNPRKFMRLIDKDNLNILDLVAFRDINRTTIPLIENMAFAGNSGKTIDQIFLSNLINGDSFQVITTVVPHFDDNETFIGGTLIMSNMSDYYNIQTKYGITKEESIKDGLTGLHNKRYLYQFIESELSKISSDPTMYFSIVMMDIDNFKKVNDVYGHLAGDEVLKVLADNLHSKIRKNDLAARFGGEEFVLVLTGTKMLTTLMITERIRKSMESTDFTSIGINKPVTISLGVYNVTGKDYQQYTIDEIIERSDKALYYSKEHGKNRVSVYFNDEIFPKNVIQERFNKGENID